MRRRKPTRGLTDAGRLEDRFAAADRRKIDVADEELFDQLCLDVQRLRERYDNCRTIYRTCLSLTTTAKHAANRVWFQDRANGWLGQMESIEEQLETIKGEIALLTKDYDDRISEESCEAEGGLGDSPKG